MAIHREVVYLGRDNAIDLGLKANNILQDLSGVSCVQVVFGGVTVSSATSSALFDWQERAITSGTTTGWVRLMFGDMTSVSPGKYEAELIVYDVTNQDGIMWGTIPIKVSG